MDVTSTLNDEMGEKDKVTEGEDVSSSKNLDAPMSPTCHQDIIKWKKENLDENNVSSDSPVDEIDR